MLSFDEFRTTCHTAIRKAKPNLRDLSSVDDATEFNVIGLDSLDMMNFLLELEGLLEVEIGAMDMKEYNSVEKIYSYYKNLA